jgi:hypothetical protein
MRRIDFTELSHWLGRIKMPGFFKLSHSGSAKAIPQLFRTATYPGNVSRSEPATAIKNKNA